MRRIAAVLVLLAAAMVAAPPPALAATSVVISRTGLPTPIKVLRGDCGTGILTTTTAFSHVFGPSFPRSDGSLRVDSPGVDASPGLRFTSTASLADLTKLYIKYYAELNNLYAQIEVSTDETDGTHHWRLGDHIDGSGGAFAWDPYSWLGDQTWNWNDLTGTLDFEGTIADFVAAHTPTSGFKIEFIGGGCTDFSTHATYFDDLEVGIGANTTIYDFEGPPGLTMTASHGTIAAGNSVKISTRLSDGGDPVPGRTVTLWAKKAGTTTFVKIKTLTTVAPSGAASATLKPTKTTTYQWRFAGTAEIQPTRSTKKTVRVTQ